MDLVGMRLISSVNVFKTKYVMLVYFLKIEEKTNIKTHLRWNVDFLFFPQTTLTPHFVVTRHSYYCTRLNRTQPTRLSAYNTIRKTISRDYNQIIDVNTPSLYFYVVMIRFAHFFLRMESSYGFKIKILCSTKPYGQNMFLPQVLNNQTRQTY